METSESWSIIKILFVFINGLFAAFMTMLGINVRAQIKKIDQNSKDIEELHDIKVDEKTFNATLNRLDNTIETMRTENRDDFNRIHDKIDGIK